MIRTQIYLPDDLNHELKLLANALHSNFSQSIRESVKEFIKKKKRISKFNPWSEFIEKGLKEYKYF